MTVEKYLDYWLETYCVTNLPPSTLKRYNELAKPIKKHLGKIKLSAPKPMQIQDFYNELSTESNLSSTTVLKVHRMFHTAYKHAYAWRLASSIPTAAVNPPRANKVDFSVWDGAEANLLIEYDYVCCWDEDARHMLPDYVSKNFQKLIKEFNFKKIRFHDLRHTHATLLLQQGVHPKIVSERLGHSNISMTLDIYSHVLPNMQLEAVRKLESIFN